MTCPVCHFPVTHAASCPRAIPETPNPEWVRRAQGTSKSGKRLPAKDLTELDEVDDFHPEGLPEFNGSFR